MDIVSGLAGGPGEIAALGVAAVNLENVRADGILISGITTAVISTAVENLRRQRAQAAPA